MKSSNFLKYIILFCCFFVACKDAEYSVIDHAVYVAAESESKILSIEQELTEVFLVRSTSNVNEKTNIQVSLAPAYLETFNKRNSTNYKIFPDSLYSIENMNATIESGKTLAEPIRIKFKVPPASINKSGEVYAVPLTISSSNSEVLSTGSNYLYIIQPTPFADVPVLTRGRGIKFAMKDDLITLGDYTIEFLVNMSNLRQGNNNQILFNADNGPGSFDEIFTRFAADGAVGKFDKFQIKNQGKSYDANFSFKNDTWYHIACVNNNSTGKMTIYVNGILDSQFDNAKLPTTINSKSSRGVRFCGEDNNDGYMRSNMKAAEIRLWKVARSAAQVKNSMYGVDAKADGLFAYWKANEASGATLEDKTGNQNTGAIFGLPVWQLNQRVKVD